MSTKGKYDGECATRGCMRGRVRYLDRARNVYVCEKCASTINITNRETNKVNYDICVNTGVLVPFDPNKVG